ncbi:MAG: PHP domain-containing protein, partial [Chloroflexi bacterium]|nr:PHP domain-containing protein [Chloroflexota bacterium]
SYLVPHPSSLVPRPSYLVPHPSSLVPRPSYLVPHNSSLVPRSPDLELGTWNVELGTWYRGDLHCHTQHSDGENTLAELLASAKARGLDFLAITDHNTTSYFLDLPSVADDGLLLIPGEELTTYYGHANVWGIRQWVDFRGRSRADLARAAAEAHRQGALISINHPKQEGPAWELPTDFDFDAVEAWQSHWWVSNYQSLAWWERRLRAGRRVSAVGGSDLHRVGTPERPAPYELGQPCTWVFSPSLTQAAILDGIRAGHVFLSRDPDGPRITFTARYAGGQAMMGDTVEVSPGTPLTLQTRVQRAPGDLLRLISAQGVLALVEIPSDDFVHEFVVTPAAAGYYRLEVIQPPEDDLDKEPSVLMVDALTNPIYVRLA